MEEEEWEVWEEEEEGELAGRCSYQAPKAREFLS